MVVVVVVSPLGVVLVVELGVDDETLPLASIEAEVEVSLDGIELLELDGVEDELELLLGDEVSVEAVVVGGVVATVVEVVLELGVAPELL